MAKLTITGSGYNGYVYVKVGNTSYTSATTLNVDVGTEVYIMVNGYTTSSYISVNGTNVASGQQKVDYTFNITADTTIQLQDQQSGSYAVVTYTETVTPEKADNVGGSGNVTDFDFTGASQKVTLEAGRYMLECWGAQGGTYQTYQGGKGGYSHGILTLAKTTTLYVFVGGQPAANSSSRAVTSGGFNGGGNGQNRYYSKQYTYGQGGGGASDIRVGTNTLYSRIIVAGGGGGSASDNNANKYGGGEKGGAGGMTADASYVAGQTAPTNSGNYTAGTFGNGAAAATSRTDYQMGSGGGGGGWYGGYAYNTAQDSQTALRGYNGGGSGYVYTKDTEQYYPSGKIVTADYYLEDAETIAGNISFPAVSGGNETGHSGNGFVRITRLDTADKTPRLRVKMNGAWQEVTRVYKKNGGSWEEVSDPKELFGEAQSGTWSGYYKDR